MAIAELPTKAGHGNPQTELPKLAAVRINGVAPFLSASDGASERLAEAYALLSLLKGAHEVCEEVGPLHADAFATIRHEIQGRALEGIGTLIALAQYHLDCADAERDARDARA